MDIIVSSIHVIEVYMCLGDTKVTAVHNRVMVYDLLISPLYQGSKIVEMSRLQNLIHVGYL